MDALNAGGDTNHADAFTKAQALFQPASGNARIMVMFTDGRTTVGPDPAAVAAAAKAQGTTIYVIGLSGDGGIDVDALESWASSPAASYVSITPDDAELEELFADLAQNLVNPGATNIVLSDTLSDCFRITSLSAPTRGSASLQNQTTVLWQIPELGVSQSEGAALEFTVEHIGPCSGTVAVNESISFDDAEEMKRKHGFVALGGAYEDSDSEVAATISKIARNVMTRLHGEVSRSINVWRAQHGGSALKQVLLSGGSSTMLYMTEFFQEKLRLPVTYLNTFPVVAIDDSVDKELLQSKAPMCQELIGTALHSVGSCPINISLLPKVIRRQYELNAKKPYF